MHVVTVKVLLVNKQGWCSGENVSVLWMISHGTFVHVSLSLSLSLLLFVQQEEVKDTQKYSRLSE